MIRYALITCLLLSPLANADGWQDGNKAFDNGDYTTALRHWLPLAKNGMAEAQFNMA
ncbi:MAG: sel1 repeat family protein, partial [Magnetococcales bacterium]|nr:sel1 repeat family protein [Magnetococcales bacterium]NGZ29548.1 sel1 repeat family protein [Magnetococcales bacterium]